jgi:hypothetical protein
MRRLAIFICIVRAAGGTCGCGLKTSRCDVAGGVTRGDEDVAINIYQARSALTFACAEPMMEF